MFISFEFCHKCNAHTYHTNNHCNVCSSLGKDRKEEEWKSLKIEDKIEALKKRIEKLEVEAKDKKYRSSLI